MQHYGCEEPDIDIAGQLENIFVLPIFPFSAENKES